MAWGPQWRFVKPFAVSNAASFASAIGPPPSLIDPVYTAGFNEVKAFGVRIDPQHPVTPRTPEQERTGLFWAYDQPGLGPPPVLFVRSLEEIAGQAENTPAENARMFAVASVSMADAAIAAWDVKYQSNFWRPVAAIREANTDPNPATIGDPTWRPLGSPGDNPGDFNDDFTPPFPSWTSGHATMGGAMFKSLQLFFETNNFEDIDGIPDNDATYSLSSEEVGAGPPRNFSTFTQNGLLHLGTENSPQGEIGTSRVYLGVDWIFSGRAGITLGNNIAASVAAKFFQPLSADFNGDRVVDNADLDQWAVDFGDTSSSDADNDDDSDGGDFLIWQQQRGRGPVVTAFSAVPEPGSAALLLLGCGAAKIVTRRNQGSA